PRAPWGTSVRRPLPYNIRGRAGRRVVSGPRPPRSAGQQGGTPPPRRGLPLCAGHQDRSRASALRSPLGVMGAKLDDAARSIRTGEAPPMKVGIVGAGRVGVACLSSVVARGVASEVVLVNRDRKKAKGVVADLQYGAILGPHMALRDGDAADLAGAAVVLIT